MWVLSMGLASCHRSGASNSEVTSRFLEKFCTPGAGYYLNNAKCHKTIVMVFSTVTAQNIGACAIFSLLRSAV
jgi:hypothetical protein